MRPQWPQQQEAPLEALPFPWCPWPRLRTAEVAAAVIARAMDVAADGGGRRREAPLLPRRRQEVRLPPLTQQEEGIAAEGATADFDADPAEADSAHTCDDMHMSTIEEEVERSSKLVVAIDMENAY